MAAGSCEKIGTATSAGETLSDSQGLRLCATGFHETAGRCQGMAVKKSFRGGPASIRIRVSRFVGLDACWVAPRLVAGAAICPTSCSLPANNAVTSKLGFAAFILQQKSFPRLPLQRRRRSLTPPPGTRASSRRGPTSGAASPPASSPPQSPLGCVRRRRLAGPAPAPTA